MSIIKPTVIVPDSSHWAKWIDSTFSTNVNRRRRALAFYDRLIEAGRIPLLSGHHLQELLGGEDDYAARARIALAPDFDDVLAPVPTATTS